MDGPSFIMIMYKTNIMCKLIMHCHLHDSDTIFSNYSRAYYSSVYLMAQFHSRPFGTNILSVTLPSKV